MMTIRRLGYHALRYTSRIPSRRKSFLPLGPLRLFHVTPIYNNDLIQEPSKPFVFDVSALSPNDRHTYNLLSSEDKIKFEEEAKLFHEYMNSPKVESELNSEVSQALAESAQQFEPAEIKIPRIKVGLMAMGEDEEQESGEDDEFEGDDITSLAHAELEQHREMREYARIAAWEMPMLSSVS